MLRQNQFYSFGTRRRRRQRPLSLSCPRHLQRPCWRRPSWRKGRKWQFWMRMNCRWRALPVILQGRPILYKTLFALADRRLKYWQANLNIQCDQIWLNVTTLAKVYKSWSNFWQFILYLTKCLGYFSKFMTLLGEFSLWQRANIEKII